MAKDHRITAPDGSKINYTCENRRFKTNLNKGYSHGSKGEAKGSVLEEPLYDGGSYSLWIEHVIEKGSDRQVFWLMWYNEGVPTIPASGVLDDEDLDKIISNLAGVRQEILQK